MDSSSGYARAVQPIRAEAIHTDAEGLDAGDLRIPTVNGSIPAYHARPRKGNLFPVILVVHEIFGVHEHIRDVCRRLAKLGYFAIAPDLYHRQGDVSSMQDFQEIHAKVVARVPDAQAMADLESAADYAASTKGDVSRLGITGFCWGGRIAWLFAAASPRLKAAVAWYGRLAGQPDDLHPRHPIDIAATVQAPVLGLYGGQDQSIPLDTIERMRDAYLAAHKNCEIIVYPDAGHAFFADYRPSYNKPAAEDGWWRMKKWFEQYLNE